MTAAPSPLSHVQLEYGFPVEMLSILDAMLVNVVLYQADEQSGL